MPVSKKKPKGTAYARINEDGLIEIVVPKGGGGYVHEFDPETHLALAKGMFRSVVGQVKDRRKHSAWLRIVHKVQALTLDDLYPYPSEDE